MFRRFLAKNKAKLEGAPIERRMKTYPAESGYVYVYFYEGHRPFAAGEDRGVEFVFTISSDRKTWQTASVMVSESAITEWERSHERTLSMTERYAVAKIALFQAFDERPDPAQMRGEVRVRLADVDGIIEKLGL